MENQIQILPSHKIDPLKWNNCVEKSSNSLIYADFFFLTSQCDQWSGLIIDDYKTILPLPWRKKWGIRYLYAPAFIQQLGFFGHLSNLPITEIINSIIEFAKFGDLFFNYQNRELLTKIEYSEKTNYILDLKNSYPKIYSDYSHDLIKNLQKSEKHPLKYVYDVTIEVAIQQFQLQYQNRFPHLNLNTFQGLTTTCLALAKRNQCIVRSAYSDSTNEVLSIALLLKDNKRLYLLLNTTNKIGRSFAANHYLLDQIIQEFCEEEILLDFEGSEHNGIKEFYEAFHPKNQPYFHYRLNKLPFLINFIRTIITRSEAV
jgi:hypothetical protein